MTIEELEELFNIDAAKRIKFYRKLRKLTQKQLGELCGLSEPAIRNYELANRTPDAETLKKITDALGVDYYAVAEPNLAVSSSVLHTLFKLESMFNLQPVEIDGRVYLDFAPKNPESKGEFQNNMVEWLDQREKLLSGEITKEEYVFWEATYFSNKNKVLIVIFIKIYTIVVTCAHRWAQTL